MAEFRPDHYGDRARMLELHRAHSRALASIQIDMARAGLREPAIGRVERLALTLVSEPAFWLAFLLRVMAAAAARGWRAGRDAVSALEARRHG